MVKEIELAILFADVVGSTQLYESLGDEQARETVSMCIDVMRQATEKNNGTVIKTMGDEVMSTFPTPDDALNAGALMQHKIAESPELTVSGVPVAIRIGCHYGPVVLENRDIFGSAVHTANRMTSQAKGGQILTTASTVNRLSPEWRSAVRQIDVAHVRGQAAEMALYEVLWQAEDVTSMLPSLKLTVVEGSGGPGRLILEQGGQEFILDETNTGLTLGRAESNGLVIKGNLISRQHARVELRKSHFVLVDQSTNGTFVDIAGADEEAFVRRDSFQLTGSGTISLGKKASVAKDEKVLFRLEKHRNPPA
ncbi:MAG: adenylate/guanylate cyclase domain-containing protein [Gammaproteobacteria bacterium]|jgi:class 3 adenylate cyclase|nr:adenylate/guanylate cyclase domain-containing protein [Gammaproteobacteria bacterium]